LEFSRHVHELSARPRLRRSLDLLRHSKRQRADEWTSASLSPPRAPRTVGATASPPPTCHRLSFDFRVEDRAFRLRLEKRTADLASASSACCARSAIAGSA